MFISTFLFLNPFQQITTKDLQIEINDLKTQVKYLKTEVMALKTVDLTIEAKLTLLQSQKTDQEIPSSIPVDISGISELKYRLHSFYKRFPKLRLKNGIR